MSENPSALHSPEVNVALERSFDARNTANALAEKISPPESTPSRQSESLAG